MQDYEVYIPPTYEELTKEAVELLRKYEPPNGYYVAFSGGKDSLVIYWLTKIAGVKAEYWYNFTSVDPPELVKFVRTFDDVNINYPKETMWDLIRKHKFPPNRQKRYCCRDLKENGGLGRLKILGVREEESTNRHGREILTFNNKAQTVGTINLIYKWREIDVWDFIRWNLIDYCELYDRGHDRLGCVGCPLKKFVSIQNDFKEYPLYKKAYIKAFDDMVKIRKEEGKECYWNNGEEVMRWYETGWKKGIEVYEREPVVKF